MFRTKQESGQSIALIVVTIFGLIVLSALIVDGGNMYLNRREAQTAADAAALAAAREYCVNKTSIADADLVAQDFALNQNEATKMIDLDPLDDNPDNDAAPYILVDNVSINKNVKVAVELEHSTFFARVFGLDTTIVEATASAGCYPPKAADSVIPVAWTCRSPLPGVPSDSIDCDYKSIPWRVFKEILQEVDSVYGCPLNPKDPGNPYGECLTGNGPLIYHDNDTPKTMNELALSDFSFAPADGLELQINIIMDSVPLGVEICEDNTGGISDFCDIDNDGRIDWTNSQRSWLLLDENSNAGQLPDIIDGSLTFGMVVPGWYPGKDGGNSNAYITADDAIEGKPVLIPVFKEGYVCQAVDPRITCPDKASLTDHVMKLSGADEETYYYVIGFAEFYVSCVSDAGNANCPGKNQVITALEDAGYPDLAKGFKNEKSVEGYFMNGWVADNPEIQIGENQIDLGIYVITLTE